MKNTFRNLFLALLPLLAGLVGYIVLHARFQPVTVLVFKADVGSALAVAGGLLAAVLVSGWLGWQLAARRGERMVEDVRQAEMESRRRFIRRLDHELKNPLTGLRAALANLNGVGEDQPVRPPADRPSRLPGSEKTLREEAEHTRALSDARYQTERLSRLVADLRKLAELEERPIEVAPVDVGEILEEVVELAQALPQYELRQVNLNISRVPWPLPAVTGDRDLLGLAFYNLVENALKYSSAADTVEVRAVDDGRWLTVEVADTGPGIAVDDLPRIFEELYRGTNARGLEGSGLGLALVRRVIDRHGGEISVRSRQSAQKGTLFRVRLPVTGRQQGS